MESLLYMNKGYYQEVSFLTIAMPNLNRFTIQTVVAIFHGALRPCARLLIAWYPWKTHWSYRLSRAIGAMVRKKNPSAFLLSHLSSRSGHEWVRAAFHKGVESGLSRNGERKMAKTSVERKYVTPVQMLLQQSPSALHSLLVAILVWIRSWNHFCG